MALRGVALTNLKRLKKRNVDDIKLEMNDDIKACVFSRINKDKGVEDAIAAIKIVNERLGAQRVKGISQSNAKEKGTAAQALLCSSAFFREKANKRMAKYQRAEMFPYFKMLC